jgi:DNA (cytosine-5)-methyltransferase 1
VQKSNFLSSVEVCAGAGGQAIGLEKAGFQHAAILEIDTACCATLRLNRPTWNIIEGDLNDFDGRPYAGVDLFSGGLPCPPFSKAGKQLGIDDDRNLFPAALRLVDEIRPRAVMFENVRGFLDAVFEDYRLHLKEQLRKLGYYTDWKILNASDYGVPQLRPRVAIVALKQDIADSFSWPKPSKIRPKTVGQVLSDLMAENGWEGVERWKEMADDIAPTIVGGSKKHGGPDLGPTRSKKAWAALGTDGHGVWDEPPNSDFVGMPRLTVRMCARLQGFSDDWQFSGKKTSAYRQVGNAFPPPVAYALGKQIAKAIAGSKIIHKVS